MPSGPAQKPGSARHPKGSAAAAGTQPAHKPGVCSGAFTFRACTSDLLTGTAAAAAVTSPEQRDGDNNNGNTREEQRGANCCARGVRSSGETERLVPVPAVSDQQVPLQPREQRDCGTGDTWWPSGYQLVLILLGRVKGTLGVQPLTDTSASLTLPMQDSEMVLLPV